MVMKGEAMEVRDASVGYALQVGMPVVPKGYKQTEVGVIPEDWEVKRLGQLGNFHKGQGVKRSDSAGGNIPCIRYGEIYTQHNDIVRCFISYISREIAETAERLRSGDILFAGSGETKSEIGKAVAFIGEAEAYAGGDIVILRQKVADPSFLGYLLNSPVVVRQKSSKGQGDAIVHISASALASMQIPLPCQAEQRAIAIALSDMDALLEALDRLIAKKRDIKQATMQQLLTGQTRLPGFEGEWEVQRLGEFAPLQRGFDLPTTQIKNGKYPVVYSNGILNYHECYQVKGPGVVTGRSGTIGRVTFVSDHYWPHNTSLWVTNFKGNDPKFVFYLYSRLNFERFSSGSGVPTLNRNDLHALDIFIPNELEEQVAISTVLSDIDAEIQALHQRRTKTAALKQAMMQELLTGRTRLVSRDYAYG